MKLDFKVHSVLDTETPMSVLVKGKEMTVSVPCYEVVLTDVETTHGSLVLRFTGTEYDVAKEKFKAGEVVALTVT